MIPNRLFRIERERLGLLSLDISEVLLCLVLMFTVQASQAFFGPLLGIDRVSSQ